MSEDKSPKKPRKPSYWDNRTKALMALWVPNPKSKLFGLHYAIKAALSNMIAADNAATMLSWPSQETMATCNHLGLRTIERAIAVLQAIGAIGIVYRTRDDALAAGIPVRENGCPTMNVTKVYYDWDGYSKLTPELVDAINAVVADKACLVTPWVWHESPRTTSNRPSGRLETRQRGGRIAANVAGVLPPTWRANASSNEEGKLNAGCARQEERGGVKTPPVAEPAGPATWGAPLFQSTKNWQESYPDPYEDK